VYIKDCVSLCVQKKHGSVPEVNTVMCHLTMAIGSDKRVVRRFCHCANVIECIYTNVDSIAYCTPLGVGGQWHAPAS